MVGINNNLVTSEKKILTTGSTRLTTISAILIRGGVVFSSLISVFICYFFATEASSIDNTNFVFFLLLILILNIIILNIGIITYLYCHEKIKTFDRSYKTALYKNVKVYVIISLILANWALAFIPY
ncbi:MAG: hypothetical protein ACFFC6_10950, partial [Promethearchaeota archaeon]